MSQPIPESAPIAPPKGSTRMPPMAVGLVVVIFAAAAFLFLKNGMYKSAQDQSAGSAQSSVSDQPIPSASQEEIVALIAKVAAHITVKKDESPTIATIQNADMLRAQNPSFYKDAQVGDRLLIWSDKAVLYSPASDKVLSVLPITLPPNAGTASTSTMVSSTVAIGDMKIEVRNGSGITGLGKTTAANLTAKGFTVLPATSALSSTPYEKSIIIVTDKASASAVSKLQEVTGASVVTSPPAVEGTPKGDILLIVGLDAKQ